MSESENEVVPLESEHGYPASPSTISPETVDDTRGLAHALNGYPLYHNIDSSALGAEDQAGEFGVNSPVSPSPFKRPLWYVNNPCTLEARKNGGEPLTLALVTATHSAETASLPMIPSRMPCPWTLWMDRG